MTQTITEPAPTRKTEPPRTKEQTGFSSYVGINEAARLTRRSKGQISQDTKSGRLSFELNERQQKQYQVAELDRVYGLKTGDEPVNGDRQKPEAEPAPTSSEIALLRAQLEMQNEVIKDLRADKEKLWEQLQHQLPSPQPAAPIIPAAPPRPKTFWQRLTGK